jgi:hypothetical protein
MKFKEPEPKAAPAPRDPAPVKVKPKAATDPKAVRAWARDNGIVVGDRGRIDAKVINAYVDAQVEGGLKVEAPAVDPSQDFRPSRRVRPDVLFDITDLDGSVRTVNYRTACNVCGYSFSGCFCETPKVFSQVSGSLDVLVVARQTDRVAPVVRFW